MATAIVTGGTRGFGRALAQQLIESGWEVVIDGRDRDVLNKALAELGSRAHGLAGDVTDEAHRRDLVNLAIGCGGVRLLINNAGALGPSPLPNLRDLESSVLTELAFVNVAAPLALIQLALPALIENGGAIVNVTSDAAVEPYEGWGAYGSSKAALEQLSNVLAVEEPAVRVWWLDPGDMRTEMHQRAFPGEDISDRPEPEEVAPALLELLAAWPPSGRIRAAELLGVR